MSLSSRIVVARLGIVLVGVAGGCSSSGGSAVDGAAGGDAGAPDAPAAADASTGADAPVGDAGAAGSCRSDDDCQLVNDCCSCEAIPRGENAPVCDPKRSCVTSVCAQFPGVERAHCAAGRCVLGFDCDATMIACKRLAPVCPAGQVPQVVGQGGARCYGACVDARQCLTVPACSACRPTDLCTPAGASTALHCLDPGTNAFEER